MIRIIATYLATAVAFAAVDAVWLFNSGALYRPTLDPVLRPESDPLNFPAAIVFYVVYIAGIVALAIWPNRDKPLKATTITGAMLGAMAYATYDLTNQASLKVWSTTITVVDICWGAFLTAAAATVGGFVLHRFKS